MMAVNAQVHNKQARVAQSVQNCGPCPLSTQQGTEATEAPAWVLFRLVMSVVGLTIQGRADRSRPHKTGVKAALTPCAQQINSGLNVLD